MTMNSKKAGRNPAYIEESFIRDSWHKRVALQEQRIRKQLQDLPCTCPACEQKNYKTSSSQQHRFVQAHASLLPASTQYGIDEYLIPVILIRAIESGVQHSLLLNPFFVGFRNYSKKSGYDFTIKYSAPVAGGDA